MQTSYMDPKLNGLDPKLKEAYDRVMNGPSAPPAGQAPQGQTAPQPAQPQPAQPQTTAQIPTQPLAPQAPIPVAPNFAPITQPAAAQGAAVSQPSPSPAVNSTIAFNAHNSGINKNTTTVKKSGGIGKMLMIGLVLLILLVIYTFVWIFVLKLKVPFLP